MPLTQTPVQIIIVSNRGPFSFSIRDRKPHVVRGAGGLVTAIQAVARQHLVTWIACALGEGDRTWLTQMGDEPYTVDNLSVRLVATDPQQYHGYYNVISNPLLWFIQHQMHDEPRKPVFDEPTWNAWTEGYRAVNRQLAECVAESIAELDGQIIVMPQDYHLYLLPRYLRELVGDQVIIQPFVHIPWPGPDAWRVLPLALRRELLTSMLQADRLGFQTERDTRRFLQTCADTLPDVRVVKPWRRLAYGGRQIDAAPYPISIDVENLESRFLSEAVQHQLDIFTVQYAARKLILRIDRVDPSKNILRGFLAFRNFLKAYPDYHGKVAMLALLVPSRTDIPEYKQYLRDVMALVGDINATFGDGEWEPIRVLLGNNYDRALAVFSLYDVLLVNPLADGMNLVVKEGVVLNKKDGVVILSEEAGAAEAFGDLALLISPYDVFGTREAIHQALTMPPNERRERAQKMADQVRRHDVHRWFENLLVDTLAESV